MNLKDRLQRMLQILEESERVEALADIERDIILNDLREAYAELKFGKTENGERKTENDVAKEQAVEPTVEESVEEPVEESVEESVEEPVAEESVVEEQVVEEVVAEEQVAEKPAEKDELSSFVSRPSSKSVLLSLYEDTPAPIVGEQFHEAPSVADVIACPKGLAEIAPVVSLREAIGVADRFMIIRELFGEDVNAYEKAIDALDMQPSFDDCIIYIAEHFAWSPNLQATKFMMDLLQRKYN